MLRLALWTLALLGFGALLWRPFLGFIPFFTDHGALYINVFGYCVRVEVYHGPEERPVIIGRWIDLLAADRACRGAALVLPYVHYVYEYPPLDAVFWVVATFIARSVVGGAVAEEPGVLGARSVAAWLAVVGLALFPAALLLGWVVGRVAGRRALLALLASPTLVFYSVHNWDLVAATFLLYSLYLFQRGRYAASGLALAASTLSKLLPAAVFPLLLLRLLREEPRAAPRFTASFVAPVLASYAGIALASPLGFYLHLDYLAGWYCENCLWLLLVHDPWSPLHRILFLATAPVLLLAIYILALRGSSTNIYLQAFAVLGVLYLASYIFTPQMMIPLLVLAVTAGLRGWATALLRVADAANAALIVAWGYGSALLSLLGLEAAPPVALESPAQWLAQARNICLAAVTAAIVYRALAGDAVGGGEGEAHTSQPPG